MERILFRLHGYNDRREAPSKKALQQGMSFPIFHYTWNWGGSRAGVNPHAIWRVPPLSDRQARDEVITTCQRNIEYLKKNTVIYHTRAKHTAYMVVGVNKDFVRSVVVANVLPLTFHRSMI